MAKDVKKQEPEENLPAQTQGTQVALVDEDMEQYAGAGASTRPEDTLLPFLYVAQSNSPQTKRQSDKYIEGLEAGDIFNTANRKFWKGDEGVLVVPCWFEAREVEWVTRKEGGGYVGSYPAGHEIVRQVRHDPADKRLRLLPNGHQLVETRYHFCISAETMMPVVVGFASTGLQTSRLWQAMIQEHKARGKDGQLFTLPSFSHKYRLRTVWRKNDQGDWFQMTVEDEGPMLESDRDIYQAAKSLFIYAREHGGLNFGRPPEEDGAPGAADDTTEPPI